MFEVMLFFHILGAAAWFGANLVRAFVGSPMSTADPATAATWHRATASMGRVIHTPAAILVFITGFGLVGWSDGNYGLAAPFVVVGIIVVVVGAVLAMSVIGPNAERIASAYEEGDLDLARTVIRRSSLVGWVDTALVAFTTLVMVLRWGA